MKEAAVRFAKDDGSAGAAQPSASAGFDPAEIAVFLRKNADHLERAKLPSRASISPEALPWEAPAALRALADEVTAKKAAHLEDVERRLTVLEEKLFAGLLAAAADDGLVRGPGEAAPE